MKILDSSRTLLLIVGVSVVFGLLEAFAGGQPAIALLRILLELLLCFFMMRGKNAARLTLCAFYLVSAIMSAKLLLTAWPLMSVGMASAQASFLMFKLIAAAFLYFSPVLRALTTQQKNIAT